jgi:hypothetical protein
MTTMINLLTGNYTPSFEILRNKNIKYIFMTTIHPMNKVVDKYDYCLTRLCSRIPEQKIDNMREEIHDRAFDLTLKLLN